MKNKILDFYNLIYFGKYVLFIEILSEKKSCSSFYSFYSHGVVLSFQIHVKTLVDFYWTRK